MDSRAIANALKERYPEPPLGLDAPELQEIEEVFPKAFMPLRAVVIPRVPIVLLNERSVEYFNQTRKEAFGMSLEEVERTQGGDAAYQKAEEPLAQLAKIVERSPGPFVLPYEGEFVAGIYQPLAPPGAEAARSVFKSY